MALQYKYASRAAVSSFTKETAYDTAGTVNASNFHTLQEFDLGISYDDTRRDSAMGDGTELGSEGYIVRKDVRMSLTIDHLRPNDLSWLAAYALGTTGATQDGALTAYRHKATMAATLPTFSVVATEAGVQRIYTGCAINSLTLKKSDAYWGATAEIIGSGRRATNADSYPASVTEQPLLYGNTSVWMEDGADVNIATAPTQGSASISAATADNIKARVYEGVTITINNNLRADQGYSTANSNDVLCRGALDRGARREITVEFPLTFEAATEETNFLGTNNVQSHMAIEVHGKETAQGVIASTGAMYYGGVIILPRFVYDVIGGSSDSDGVLIRTIKGIVKTPTAADENTTDAIQIYSYTAKSAYAA